MKKYFCAALFFLICLPVFAEMPVSFFGNNNFTIDVDTAFSVDMNDGSTGLLTNVGLGLWFEFTPYADRNITPRKDALSVSLKLANSAFYAWRGYDLNDLAMRDRDQVPSDVTIDQAKSVWFDNFTAQLEYGRYWLRIAGIEPEVSVSQASIKSVFDPVMANRTDIAKNRIPLPLFYAPGNAFGGSWSHGTPGISSVINRDLVHLNRREVEIAGNVSAGLRSEIFDIVLKAGSWKIAESNMVNSWIGGGDVFIRPDFVQLFKFSFLAAVNYGTITRKGGYGNQEPNEDPSADVHALEENPIAFGFGYEYRINLPKRMVMKPYAGIDFIWETKSGGYDYEIGGGLQWFFRGTGAAFKRNTKIGNVQIGDVEIPAAFVMGANVNRNGVVNAVVSFNEDPRSSPLPKTGGWLQVELLNISGKEFTAINGQTYNDFLWAGIAQIEYQLTAKVMPYIFGKYVPADRRGKEINDTPVYSKDISSFTSKLGCRFTPFNYFSVDAWYERTDVRNGNKWSFDNGLFSIMFAIWNY